MIKSIVKPLLYRSNFYRQMTMHERINFKGSSFWLIEAGEKAIKIMLLKTLTR